MPSRASLARSEAPEDPRPYVRVSTDLPTNPKLDAIDNPAAGWAYVVSLCYCAQSLTDGHFPLRGVLRMANVDEAIAMALVEQGLWHLPDHDCDRCEQPKQGHVIVHDYLQHQRSADEVRDLTSKRREAGRKGAASRWSKEKAKGPGKVPKPRGSADHPKPGMANAIASAMANGQQDPWQNDGKAMAEEMRGDETKEPPTEVLAPPPASAPKPGAGQLAIIDATDIPESSKEITARDIVAAFIDTTRAAELPDPTTGVIGKISRDAKRLLTKEKVDPQRLMEAVVAMADDGYTSLDMQLHRMNTDQMQADRMRQSRSNGQLARRDSGSASQARPSTATQRFNQALEVAAELDRQHANGGTP